MTQPSSPLPEIPAVGFLEEVSAEHRAFLTSFGKFLRPKNGEILIEEGSRQDALYLILSGTIHVVSSAGERPVLLASLGEGEVLGEVNLFDPATASATVIARSEGLIWSVSREEVEGISNADPVIGVEFLKGLLKLAGRRIRAMNAKLADSQERAAFHDFWHTNP